MLEYKILSEGKAVPPHMLLGEGGANNRQPPGILSVLPAASPPLCHNFPIECAVEARHTLDALGWLLLHTSPSPTDPKAAK